MILFVVFFITVTEGYVLQNLNSRIVNGTAVELGEIPFQVSLQSDNFCFCGGSIVNEYYVVTAAHCVQKRSPLQVEVVAGTTNWKIPGEVRQAIKFIIHDKYDPSNSYINDIALIKVNFSFVFSNIIQPVVLPELHQKVPTNSIAVVSGWGRLGGLQMIKPETLQKAEIFVADPEYCKNVMTYEGYKIYSTHICANNPSFRKGHCSGDSGGPLTVDGKLIGIVSWSIKDPYCASTKYPGVYTRVTEYVDWIFKNEI